MAKPKTRTISYTDYLKLEGLLVLSADHNRALADINRAAAEITGEPDDGYGYYGSTSDEVNEQRPSAGDLLRRLGVSVAPRETQQTKETP